MTQQDIHISLEDQQKINKFARHNQRLEDIKDELKVGVAGILSYRYYLGKVVRAQQDVGTLRQSYGTKMIFYYSDPDPALSLMSNPTQD